MKTDILFSSPRLRFSRAQQEAVLSWGKDLGASNGPSLYALEMFQSEALEAVGNPTEKISAASGNVWYKNSIRTALKMVWPLSMQPIVHLSLTMTS